MNKLVFVAVVVGVWGLALFWITMETPKTNASDDEEFEITDDGEPCRFIVRIQHEVHKLTNKAGIAHLVPKAISSESYQGCEQSSGEDNDEEHDPRANQIKGGLQRRKVFVSTIDTFLPDNLIYSVLSVFS